MSKGAITFKDGRVEQRDFDGYTPPYTVDAPTFVDCSGHCRLYVSGTGAQVL